VAIVTADFNKDNHSDIAVANYESENVTVLLGNGSGDFNTAGPFDADGGPAARPRRNRCERVTVRTLPSLHRTAEN
jgi:hypothetical protein